MQHSRIYIIIIIIALLISCIEEYIPDLDSNDANLYVVEGRITDIEGFHTILISKSTEISKPKRIPVSNCEVKIYDDNDNIFTAEEYNQGEYRVYMSQDYLAYGTAFRLEIFTPEGDILNSQYDTLRFCPEIDSIYYEIENFIISNSDEKTPGIQFYLDYDGKNSSTNKIKIELEETWEYHADYPLKWTWDGWRLTEYNPPDYSKQICWRTQKSDQIYSFTTEKLSSNVYKRFPLHRVLNTSNKLLIGYSLLIKQLSISEDAMEYYEKVNANIINESSLYDTQPQLFEGNISNISNDTRVLGYFSTVGIKTKRIFINYVEGLSMNVVPTCEPLKLDLGYGILRGLDRTVILWLEGGNYRLNPVCVDCTILGGETTKPDFWPN